MLPPAVKHILIVNVIAYLAYYVLLRQGIVDLNAVLGLWSIGAEKVYSDVIGFRIWQPLTYTKL